MIRIPKATCTSFSGDLPGVHISLLPNPIHIDTMGLAGSTGIGALIRTEAG